MNKSPLNARRDAASDARSRDATNRDSSNQLTHPAKRNKTSGTIHCTDPRKHGSQFLIVAHQRSGSSSLVRYIQSCTGLRGVMEPFRKKYADKQGIDISCPHILATFLVKYFEKYDFAKHLYNSLTGKMNTVIYSHASVQQVIFLYRKDLCAALMSSKIAKATGKWRETILEHFDAISLDPQQFALELYTLKRLVERNFYSLKGIAAKRALPVMRVCYEDLYSTDESHQREVVQKILTFIDHDATQWNRNGAFDKLISHKNRYAANKEVRVSNYASIHQQFGNTHPELDSSWRATITSLFS
jgi:hypothetical protein